MAALSIVGEGWAIALVGLVLFCAVERNARRALALFVPLALALVLAGGAVQAVKALVASPRPLATYGPELVRVTLEPLRQYGFPSGHSASAAALAAFGALVYRRGRWLWALALAVGLSRVYVGAHWALDVAGGLALGAASGALAYSGAVRLRPQGRVAALGALRRAGPPAAPGEGSAAPLRPGPIWPRLAALAAARPIATIVVAGLAVRAVIAAAVPLGVDEAYYIEWARHLSPGYFDHPPLVAWLVAPFLHAFGPVAIAVRLPALLLQAGTTLLAASLARSLAGERAGLTAAVLLQAAPVFSLGAVLVTPDAPLAFAWVGTLWALERALRRNPRWFLAAGAFLGLGALSKLTAGLLAVALLAALLATRDGRRALAGPWLWAGVLVAAAIASPMLAWNATHGWPNFLFQAKHGLGGRSFSIARLAGSLGAQAGYVSPVLLAVAVPPALRALRDRSDPARLALAFSALPIVLFFTASASVTPGALPHWPGPGWLSAILLLSATAAGTRRVRTSAWVGLALSAAAVLAVALPIPGGPMDELRGWREAVAQARDRAGGATLATTHWIAYGQLSWYAGESLVYAGDRVYGPSFYAPDPAEPLLVVAVDRLGPSPERIAAMLGPLEPAGTFTATAHGAPVRTYRFFRATPPFPCPRALPDRPCPLP